MTADVTRRVQSLYVPASDGVRLAVDLWLPVGQSAAAGQVPAAQRLTAAGRPATLRVMRKRRARESTTSARAGEYARVNACFEAA